MTDQQPPELFAERPVRSDFARQGLSYAARRFITVVVLLCLVGGALYWKFNSRPHLPPGEIPTVKSEGPYKQRPENPGGIDIPHQDVQVYQELDGNAQSQQDQVEHLLPPPEAPNASNIVAPPPQVAAAPAPVMVAPSSGNIETVPAQDVLKQDVQVTPAPSTPPAVPAKPLKTTASRNKPTTSAPVQKQTLDQVMANIKNGAVAAAAPAHGRVIQMAALQDQAAAQSEAARLQKKYTFVLGSVKLHVSKVDLGAKGTVYRVQSGVLPEDQAKSLCASLKDINAGCILARN